MAKSKKEHDLVFGRYRSSWELIKSTFHSFGKHPILLAPLIYCWIIYAGTYLYIRFIFDWEQLSTSQSWYFVFFIFFFYSSLFCFSCCWLLELIYRLEKQQKSELFETFLVTLSTHTLKMLPIAFVWSVIWFALPVLESLFKDEKVAGKNREGLTFQSATMSLSGMNSDVSFTGLTFSAIKKMIRMVTFLCLPAVCWQKKSPFQAMGNGLRTARTHAVEFFSGYIILEFLFFCRS